MEESWLFYSKTALPGSVIDRGVLFNHSQRQYAVFSKSTALEIAEILNGELTVILNQPAYTHIVGLQCLKWTIHQELWNTELFEPNIFHEMKGNDLLVVVSEKGYLSLVSFNPTLKRFVFVQEIPLSNVQAFAESLTLVSVDPRSRAIAVASDNGSLQVYLISSRFLTKGLRIEEKCHYLDINFIYSNDDEQNRIFLAALIYNPIAKRFFVNIYEFDFSSGKCENKSRPKWTFSFFPEKDAFPSKIIPLPQCPKSFFVALENRFDFYHFEHESQNPRSFPLPVEPNYHPGTFVTYTVSDSLNNFGTMATTTSILYVSLDDGRLYHISVTLDPVNLDPSVQFILLAPTKLEDDIKPNRTPPATCLLELNIRSVNKNSDEMDETDGEIVQKGLLVAGELADGAIYVIDSNTKALTQMSIIPNWASIIDAKMIDKKRQLLTCSGLDEGGSLRQIVNGFKLDLLKIIELGDTGTTGIWGLKTDGNSRYRSHLCISFIASTRLVSYAAGDLEDVSDQSGLILNSSTLAISSLPTGHLIQVCWNVIRVTKPRLPSDLNPMHSDPIQWYPPEGSNIVLSKIQDGLIVLAISIKSNWQHKLIELGVRKKETSDELEIYEVGSFPLSADPCSIDIFIWSTADLHNHGFILPNVFCAVGTYKQELLILSLATGSPFDLVTQMDLTLYAQSSAPTSESTYLFKTPHFVNLIVGLRDGTVYCFDAKKENDKLELTKTRVEQLGLFPVQLVEIEVSNEKWLFALSQKPWKISSSQFGLLFTPILCDRLIHLTSFSSVENVNGVMGLNGNELLEFNIDPKASAISVSQIPLADTPRRIVYDPETELAIVALVSTSNRVQTSKLSLVDPMSSQTQLVKSFPAGEVVFSLAMWQPIEGYRFLCVGTAKKDNGGRLQLFKIEVINNGIVDERSYSLTFVAEHNFPHLVYNLYPFPQAGKTLLLSSSASTLSVHDFTVPIGDNFAGCGIVTLTSTNTRHMIKSISASSSRIVVADQKDSLLFYAFKENQYSLEYLQGHQNPRMSADCLLINDDFAIASDLMGSVYGLSFTHHTASEVVLVPKEEVYYSLGELCLRIVPGSFIPPTSQTANETRESFMLVSMLGTVISFVRMTSAQEFFILETLQTVLAEFGPTKPFFGGNWYDYRSYLSPIWGVIDGDLINQFVTLLTSDERLVVMEICKKTAEFPQTYEVENMLRLIEKMQKMCFSL